MICFWIPPPSFQAAQTQDKRQNSAQNVCALPRIAIVYTAGVKYAITFTCISLACSLTCFLVVLAARVRIIGSYQLHNRAGTRGQGELTLETTLTTRAASNMLQLYALANVLQRPIIVGASQKDVDVYGTGYFGCAGTFFPTREKTEAESETAKKCCCNKPILLGWASSSFESFVPILQLDEGATGGRPVGDPQYSIQEISTEILESKDPDDIKANIGGIQVDHMDYE